MKKFRLYLILFLLLVSGVLFYNYTHQDKGGAPASTGSQFLQPAHVRIPAIHVDADVLNVGQNAQGQMDAPVSQAANSPYWTHVFWYDPGPAPGQMGNAVIAGHVNRLGGDPAVFWDLKKLVQGDDVYVTRVQGDTLHFIVARVVTYAATAPSSQVVDAVFGSTTEHHLNLITCSGVWTGQGFDQRLVVFTTQAS